MSNFPVTKKELRNLLDIMQEKGAPRDEMRLVVNEWGKRTDQRRAEAQGGTDTKVGQVFGNVIPSAQENAGDILHAVTHPKQTIKGTLDVVQGGIQKLVPGEQKKEESFDSLVRFFGDRYGSLERIKQTVINDPVGVALDLSGFLGGAGVAAKSASTASKASGVGKLASKLDDVSDASKATRISMVEASSKAYGVKKNIRSLTQLENSNSALRKYVGKKQKKGIDPKEIVAQTDLLKDSIDKNGVIRTTQPGGAVERLQEFIEQQENVIAEVLRRENQSIPTELIKEKGVKLIEKEGFTGSRKKNALNTLEKEIEAVIEFGDSADGKIPLESIQEVKVDMYRNINYANTDTARVDKAIARTMKELVEEHTKSANVKKLNQELSRHFDVLGYLEKLDGKRVKGGRLGNYFARGVGVVAGSPFGPLTAFAGSELAGAIQKRLQRSQFTKGADKPIQMSNEMIEAIKRES